MGAETVGNRVGAEVADPVTPGSQILGIMAHGAQNEDLLMTMVRESTSSRLTFDQQNFKTISTMKLLSSTQRRMIDQQLIAGYPD